MQIAQVLVRAGLHLATTSVGRVLKESPQRPPLPSSEVEAAIRWYNEFRPHTTLGGRAPDEVYFARFPANRKPRFEPRSKSYAQLPTSRCQFPPLCRVRFSIRLVVKLR